MLTYQDLLAVGDNERNRMDFVRKAINEYVGSAEYRTAVIADEYDRHLNTTIRQYEKLIHDATGREMVDPYSSTFKCASRFLNRFIVQEVQYLLGNGVTWKNGKAKERLGDDFDTRLQDMAHKSLVGGVAHGFFNKDHIDVFSATEYVPFIDEENGSVSAGVRFWQIAINKPLRATLYELDGYTEYIWKEGRGEVLQEKRRYIEYVRQSEIDGLEVYGGENYPSFPVVPLFGNPAHQSELVGLREQIDAYDLIKSGFADDLQDIASIYWTLSKAGGMDDVDLKEFQLRLKNVRAVASVDEDMVSEPHVIDVPYAGREALLDRIRSDLYDDAMALDVKEISGGAVTATQIRAAYEPLDLKVTQFEYCVIDFIDRLLDVAGVDDEPTFTRSRIVNTSEEVQTVLLAAQYLPEDYTTQKILTIMGDGDRAEEILKQISADELNRFADEEEVTEEAEVI